MRLCNANSAACSTICCGVLLHAIIKAASFELDNPAPALDAAGKQRAHLARALATFRRSGLPRTIIGVEWPGESMDRRRFIERSAILTGSAVLSRLPGPRGRTSNAVLGIQAGAVSFVDEGTPAVLDNLQQLGAVNTIFLATFTYGRGIGGRQPRGSALPDHGKQEYDDNFHGGQFATPHPQYYRGTSIVPEKAPDHGDYDVIADVLPAAHKRGMKVICWFEDVIGAHVPGFDQAREVTLTGRPSTFACSRNPNTRRFWLGMVEDYLRSYDVDGLMWGSERQGPLGNAIGANHGGLGAGGGIACFCRYCIAAAKEQGIDAERAKTGYLELYKWCDSMRASGARP